MPERIEKKYILNFGFNPDIKKVIDAVRASTPGPDNLALIKPEIVDMSGNHISFLKKNEKYNICVTVAYNELIGDLEPEFIYNVTVLDLVSCDIIKSLCFSCRDRFRCDTTEARICKEFECNKEGFLSVAMTIALTHSDIFDFQCFGLIIRD